MFATQTWHVHGKKKRDLQGEAWVKSHASYAVNSILTPQIIEWWSIEWFLMLSSFGRSSLIFFPPLGSFEIPRRPKFHPFKPVTPTNTHDEVLQLGSLDKILWFVHSTGWKLLDSTLACLFWFFGILQIDTYLDFGIYLKSWYWTLLGLSGKY